MKGKRFSSKNATFCSHYGGAWRCLTGVRWEWEGTCLRKPLEESLFYKFVKEKKQFNKIHQQIQQYPYLFEASENTCLMVL